MVSSATPSTVANTVNYSTIATNPVATQQVDVPLW